jgi:hypothetical protein
MTTVGWYVHHHGSGHLMRFLAVRPHLDAEVVVFSSRPRPASLPERTRWVALDRDDEPIVSADGSTRHPRDASPSAGGLLHWAPLHHPGHAGRLSTIASAAAEERFDAFVVDVSVEVSLLVRLLGIPLILMTQPGERDDRPHELAFAAADAVVAPWPSDRPDPHGRRPHEVGGISRFAGRARTTAPERGRVLLLGGGVPDASAVPDDTDAWRWRRIGGDAAWVDDPWHEICAAEIVVCGAGQNAVADLAAAGARAVVIPEERPFGEQQATAAALDAAGLAVVVDRRPSAQEWPALLERARRLEPRWELWQTAGAAQRAARVVADTVERLR